MKQTIVIKMALNGPNSRTKVVKIIRLLQRMMMEAPVDVAKYRTKALKIAVSVPGVEKAEVKGNEKNSISITGDGIDSTALTKLLRKKVGYSELISVTPVKMCGVGYKLPMKMCGVGYKLPMKMWI